jgi:hypothetical protein
MVSSKLGTSLFALMVMGGVLLAAGCSAASSEGVGAEELLLGVGDEVTLESYNFPGRYVRHRNFLGELTGVASPLDRADGTFRITPGLASGTCISFESTNFPGYYLRHQGFRIKLQPFANDDLYKQDATFCIRPALQRGARDPWMSFESYNYPGHYLRHRDFHLYLERSGGPFRADATFKFVNPL